MGGMKLVRDKIPEIMRAAGQRAVVHTADPVEFQVLLRQKLTEEVDEFLMSQDPEELADILEVLYALADCLGLDAAGLEALREAKAELRGGFAERVVRSPLRRCRAGRSASAGLTSSRRCGGASWPARRGSGCHEVSG